MTSQARTYPMLLILICMVAYLLLFPPQQTRTWSPAGSDLQSAIEQRFSRMGFAMPELGTLAAMTVGYRQHLDTHIRRQFQASGAAHILAVSGLHTGIIYLIITRLLTLFGRFKPLYEEYQKRAIISLTIILLLWCYAAITGFTPSVTRAVIMLSLVEFGRIIHRDALSLNTLCAAAVLILLVHPSDLYSVSFQLSFAAVAGILLFQPGLASLVPFRWQKRSRIVRAITDIVTVSLAAQIATLPLCLYYFGQASNYFLLTNLLTLSWIPFILIGGFACLVLGFVPWLGPVLVALTSLLIRVLHIVTAFVEHLPGAVTHLSVSASMAGVMYLGLATALLAFRRSLYWLIPTALSAVLFCYMLTLQ